MATSAENGIVRIPGNRPVDETVAKLQGILQAKGVKLFVVVDHSGEAASAGLKMPNTKLLIFGNPKAGTPLMLAAPSVALDFPLKILVAEDAAGKTWISYNSPAYLQARHSLPTDLLPNIAVIEALACGLPVVAGGRGATTDLVGHGRFGLNIVVGWNDDEFQMFGVPQREPTARYEYGQEWIDAVKRASLKTVNGRVSVTLPPDGASN